MPGRKPMPVKLLDNKKRHLTKEEADLREKNEVSGVSAELMPPSGLRGAALREWKRLIPLYKQANIEILNDLDVNTIAAYCESVAIYKAAQKAYKKQPLVGMVDGRMVVNPYLKILDIQGANIAKFAEQLCLSPVGRARMGILGAKKEKEEDPTGAFLLKYGIE